MKRDLRLLLEKAAKLEKAIVDRELFEISHSGHLLIIAPFRAANFERAMGILNEEDTQSLTLQPNDSWDLVLRKVFLGEGEQTFTISIILECPKQ